MSDTRVSVLTPPGTGAIATVSVAGPRAWELVRAKFRPARGTLPEVPPLHRFWFGNLGEGAGDEVIVAVRQVEPEVAVEVHCHGGRRVVRWVVEQFGLPRDSGERVALAAVSRQTEDERALDSLARATTVKTASVLLDQYHGAFTKAVEAILTDLPRSLPQLQRLATLAPVGRHLVEPWRVVIAGPPNVGKSSLLNALAGYQRSIVSPTAGTTRDVVGVDLAFDGWPVRMTDTAGLRATGETLEAAGIALAERELAAADVVVWVMDVTEAEPVRPDFEPDVLVGNKTDLVPPTRLASLAALPVSAVTGDGLPELAAEIVRRVVPVQPEPGEAVPFTPALADRVERATAAVTVGNIDTARDHLRDCLPAV